MIPTTTRTEIKQPQINLVTVKDTGEKFYLVKSDSREGVYYTVKWTAVDGTWHEWRCSCPARKPCKHERAVNEIRVAQYKAQKAAQEQAQPVRKLTRDEYCQEFGIYA